MASARGMGRERISLGRVHRFAPASKVGGNLRCPTMFVAAEKDDLIPADFIRRAHAEAPASKKHLLVLDAGHFDLYVGDQAPHNREAQADFLALHLGPQAIAG
jgi:fermentation-respiration switch protein FrsA (DUF1100 family)